MAPTLTRRTFTAGALALAAAPGGAWGQQPGGKRRLIAFLSSQSRQLTADQIGLFLATLEGYGWIKGRDFDLAERYADARGDLVRSLVSELADLRPDLFLFSTIGNVVVARDIIGAIPTVFASGADPVVAGVAQSYRYPGGNVTGVTSVADPGIYGKRLQLLAEAVPGATRIGVLSNSDSPNVRAARPELDAAAIALGLTLVPVEIHAREDLEAAFTIFAKERVAAVNVVGDPLVSALRVQVAEVALAARLPTMTLATEYAYAGCMLSYGVSNTDNYRRAAFLVHKVLSGTSPADLPIDAAPKISLTINLRTAKALGLTLPESILLRADEFVE